MIALERFSDERHGSAIRFIYESAFPESVRAPWESISHPRDDEELLILADDDPVGFALVRYLGDTSYVFVRYFAVDGSRRGEGLGGRLLVALREHAEARGCTALLLDVEAPQDAPHPHRDDDLRRIAFYERHGLALLPVPDYAPPDHGSTGEQIALLLMGMPLGTGEALEGEHLDECVGAVYRHRYGVAGPAS